MKTFRYWVENPFDFIPRTLDYLRKSGFTLNELEVVPTGENGDFVVELSVTARNPKDLNTFHHRALNCIGATAKELRANNRVLKNERGD